MCVCVYTVIHLRSLSPAPEPTCGVVLSASDHVEEAAHEGPSQAGARVRQGCQLVPVPVGRRETLHLVQTEAQVAARHVDDARRVRRPFFGARRLVETHLCGKKRGELTGVIAKEWATVLCICFFFDLFPSKG